MLNLFMTVFANSGTKSVGSVSKGTKRIQAGKRMSKKLRGGLRGNTSGLTPGAYKTPNGGAAVGQFKRNKKGGLVGQTPGDTSNLRTARGLAKSASSARRKQAGTR